MVTTPLDLITKGRLIALTRKLVSIPSVTGQEHVLSEWMAAHFQQRGLSGVRRLPVEEAGDSDIGHFAVHGGVPTLILGPQGGNTCEIDSLPVVTRVYVQSALDLVGQAG